MTNNQTNLFPDKSSSAATKPTKWLFVTNQRNLFYMLAAGLVMPPKGFGNKYYKDSLCNFPGWIPLFANSVPSVSIEHAVSERTHLIPCLADIDLSSLRGRVWAIDSIGGVKEIMYPEEVAGSEQVLLIPAPLPIIWVKAIIYQSQGHKSSCEDDALDFDNVALSDFKCKVLKKLFSGKRGMVWPPADLILPSQDKPMDVPFAAGAMMTMLLKMANLGDIGVKSCKLAFDAEDGVAEEIQDSIISVIGEWERLGRTSEDTNDQLKKMFWNTIDELTKWQSSGTQESALDVVLSSLKSISEGLDETWKKNLFSLIEDLTSLARFGNRTTSELFKRHKKSFSRAMILFFLHKSCADLLEIRHEHKSLTEADFLVAAILFGTRDGWLKLPLELRDYPELQKAVSHRMAAMAHRIANTKIDLGVAPPRPKPLRELFTPGPRGWNKDQRVAALFLARDRKWSYIQTRITLGQGDYRLKVDGKGMHIIIDGEAKNVVTEIDRDNFFADLASERLTSKQEQKTYKLLKV